VVQALGDHYVVSALGGLTVTCFTRRGTVICLTSLRQFHSVQRSPHRTVFVLFFDQWYGMKWKDIVELLSINDIWILLCHINYLNTNSEYHSQPIIHPSHNHYHYPTPNPIYHWPISNTGYGLHSPVSGLRFVRDWRLEMDINTPTSNLDIYIMIFYGIEIQPIWTVMCFMCSGDCYVYQMVWNSPPTRLSLMCI